MDNATSIIETPRLLIKSITPELIIMPKAVREMPFDSEYSFDPYYKESYRKNPIVEMAFADLYAPEGRIILWELIFALHRIAAGSMMKTDYEEALAYIDEACADNAGGKTIRMAVIAKEEQSEQKESLAALFHLFKPGSDEPLLEVIEGTRIPHLYDTGYVNEAFRAFMQWARRKYGFSHFRLFDKDRGKPSTPPDTVTVYDPKEPDKEFYGHINFAPGDVSIDVYEKPKHPDPEIREITIDCGGGLTMLADITIERDVFSVWSDDYRNFFASGGGFQADGDTEEEVLSELREAFEKRYRC